MSQEQEGNNFNCEKWCPVNCLHIETNKRERSDCDLAVANCDCTNFVQNPIFWIVGLLALIMSSVAVRYLIISLCNRRARAAAGTVAHPEVTSQKKDSNSGECAKTIPSKNQITLMTTRIGRHNSRKITIVLTPSYADSD